MNWYYLAAIILASLIIALLVDPAVAQRAKWRAGVRKALIRLLFLVVLVVSFYYASAVFLVSRITASPDLIQEILLFILDFVVPVLIAYLGLHRAQKLI
jgi:hypothetical protein